MASETPTFRIVVRITVMALSFLAHRRVTVRSHLQRTDGR